jgi:hypothetical protein
MCIYIRGEGGGMMEREMGKINEQENTTMKAQR